MGKDRYWRGISHAYFYRSNIDPDCEWGHGDHSGPRIAVVNLAFEKFYYARQTIIKCRNAKLRERLIKSLESAGTSGYNDMKDACDHLSENDEKHSKYFWTDTAVKYASIPGWYSQKTRIVVPAVNGEQADGPVNFLNALKSELKDQRSEWIKRFFPASDAIVSGFNKSNYDGVIETLKGFSEDIDRMDKLSWLFDTNTAIEFKKIKKTISYVNLLTKFDDSLKDLEKYRSAGFSNKKSLAFLALKKAVGLVPVFGSFYQEIVGNCPILIGNFKKLCEKRQDKLLAIAKSP